MMYFSVKHGKLCYDSHILIQRDELKILKLFCVNVSQVDINRSKQKPMGFCSIDFSFAEALKSARIVGELTS